MVRGSVQRAQRGAQSLTQPVHHAVYTGDVVVGGADDGEQTLGGVLAKHSHALGEGGNRIHVKYCLFHPSPCHIARMQTGLGRRLRCAGSGGLLLPTAGTDPPD